MDARLHYSRRLLLQLQGPAACPSPVPAAPGAAVPDARRPVPAAAGDLNSDEILTLALLTCGIVAAFTFRVVLQLCAVRVTRGACCGGADDAQDDDDPEEQEQEQHQQRHAVGGAGLSQQLQAAAPARHEHGMKQPRRLPAPLVQALPCLAFSAGLELELAGSSRSECAICLTEFARGQVVRVLPRCNHGFHARCIDRWLAARPTCPTCRQPPFAEPNALL